VNLLAHIPGMLVAGAIGVWCVLAWRRGREKRRRWKLDLCPECGYDLRESRDKCPECGRPIRRYPVDNGTFTVARPTDVGATIDHR
jgi:hypothetical protein